MPHRDPIVIPVDSDSLSGLGKVTASGIILAAVGICFLALLAPLIVPIYYLLSALDAQLQGYKFSWNPFVLERNAKENVFKKWR